MHLGRGSVGSFKECDEYTSWRIFEIRDCRLDIRETSDEAGESETLPTKSGGDGWM